MKVLLRSLLCLFLCVGLAHAETEAQKNLREGNEFLAVNKTKPGLVIEENGLQYRVMKKGNGPKPKATDIVVVDYAGRHINGKEFDSSYKRGQPAKFPVNGVIKGWTQALQMMPVGSEWELYIPAKLAYGEAGMPPVIGPNEVLIFEVKLLGIEK